MTEEEEEEEEEGDKEEENQCFIMLLRWSVTGTKSTKSYSRKNVKSSVIWPSQSCNNYYYCVNTNDQ